MRCTTLQDTPFERADDFLSNECIHTRFSFQIALLQANGGGLYFEVGGKIVVNTEWCQNHSGRCAGASPRSFVWGDGFIGTQTHLPPKFNFSSDFGHFILKMVINAKLSCVKKKDRIYKKKDLLKYHNFWGDVPR